MKIKVTTAMVDEVKKYFDTTGLDNSMKDFRACWKKPFKNFKSFANAISATSKLLTRVVGAVEKAAVVGSGIIKGGEAKLSVAAQYLDDLVKLPWWLELFDKMIFRFILSITVSFLNNKLGHVWNNNWPT